MMTLIGFVVTISLLVVFHEWGHYIVARMCGVRVLAFSLGFGKVLFKRRDKNGVEWRFSAVPMGGYVSMLDSREKDSHAGLYSERDYEEGAFDKKSVAKRIAVVFAGPAMNLILAVLIYAFLGMMGTYQPSGRVGEPPAATQAYSAGVQKSWVVTNIGERSIETFNDLRWNLVSRMGEERVAVRFGDDSGASRWVDFDLRGMDEAKDPAEQLGLVPFNEAVMIVKVGEGSPAAAAGLVPGDKIVAMNGRATGTLKGFIENVRKNGTAGMTLSVVNVDGAKRMVKVTPAEATLEDGTKIGRIGASLSSMADLVLVREGPVDAVASGIGRVADFVQMTLSGFGKMITGQADTKTLAGPIAIGDMAGQSMQNGLTSYLLFLALVSVSIGVLNLLPVPVLDGGHLLYYFYEIIIGRAPSEKIIAIGQRVGLFLLLFLTVFALGNDIARLFGLN